MPFSVAIALGSNLGDRARNLRAAIHELGRAVRLVRISRVRETDPVDAPSGSPRFLNMAVAGTTLLSPEALLEALLAIEVRLGRRRGVRNAPRTIDLDLIFHSANVRCTQRLTLPHPRYRTREFVLEPLREVWVPRYRVPNEPPPS
jgi:2-amino-4-hydroxy-6-hydroxymethyldihydropteridine diphosphokinase